MTIDCPICKYETEVVDGKLIDHDRTDFSMSRKPEKRQVTVVSRCPASGGRVHDGVSSHVT